MMAADDLIHSIYESALKPDHWPVTLSKLARYFGSTGALIALVNADGRLDIINSPELNDAAAVYEEEEWWRLDIRASRAANVSFVVGDVYSDQDVASETEIAEHPMYADFLKKVGLGWLMTAVILSDLGMPVGLSVQRAKSLGSYSSSEMQTLSLLARHVEHALRISMKILESELSTSAVFDALDTMDCAVFVLSADERILKRNDHAEELLKSHFCEVSGVIHTAASRDAQSFRKAVQAASTMGFGAVDAPEPQILFGRDNEARIVMRVLPVVSDQEWPGLGGVGPRYLVLARPLESDHVVDPAVLRNMFGLTLAEARLAALLGAGMATKAAAGKLGITENTARVVLKRVFGKLGINRQAELAHQISAIGRI